MISVRRVAAGKACLLTYAAASVVDVVAQLADQRLLISVLPVVLMPLLTSYLVLSVARTRQTTILVVGLVFAWLGDSVPGSPLVLIAFFLGTQLAYCVAFAPQWRRSLIARPTVLVAYVVPVLALVVTLGSRAGDLAVPVIIYGVLVASMVALASGVGWRCTLGAVAFFISDTVLGYELFVDPTDRPLTGAIVMATYLIGQLLIVVGMIKHVEPPPASSAVSHAQPQLAWSRADQTPRPFHCLRHRPRRDARLDELRQRVPPGGAGDRHRACRLGRRRDPH